MVQQTDIANYARRLGPKMLNTHNANLCAVCRGLGAPLLNAALAVLATWNGVAKHHQTVFQNEAATYHTLGIFGFSS